MVVCGQACGAGPSASWPCCRRRSCRGRPLLCPHPVALLLQRLKSVDFYRKLPTDLTEATLSGAAISIVTTVVILFLLGAVRCSPRLLPRFQPCTQGLMLRWLSTRLAACQLRWSAACAAAMVGLPRLPSPALPCVPRLAPPSAQPRSLPLTALPQELSAFLSTQTRTDMVVDRSAHGELLRINFNISFPRLSCEFATLDVSDAMGLVRVQSCGGGRKGPAAVERRAGACAAALQPQCRVGGLM